MPAGCSGSSPPIARWRCDFPLPRPCPSLPFFENFPSRGKKAARAFASPYRKAKGVAQPGILQLKN
ncbi:hypothetical protein KL86CLO1_12079 [uncultured Eubacteriales bacterium]|uniref:Uncharacterized protein n=1 Tax=uncultured Eubacteriales bacterium TaxID=172733 RepID=A0A212K270_9FIRM|nr:hypothetical protein KL86CLO1_12079 [uncultured Eubacteriales bacterium]